MLFQSTSASGVKTRRHAWERHWLTTPYFLFSVTHHSDCGSDFLEERLPKARYWLKYRELLASGLPE